MSDKPTFQLPGSGYEAITKILHAYILCGEGKATLSDVSKKSGINPTNVSRNNAFLVGVGILENGRDKALTSDGRNLAIAISNNVVPDIRSFWNKILINTPEVKSVLDMIKVQKSISKDELPGKVASTLEVVLTKNKTGINTLIELFEKAELIELREGSYYFQTNQEEPISIIEDPKEITTHPTRSEPEEEHKINNQKSKTSIHIDLNIHISPESSSEQIDQIMKSIAKHLKE